MSPINHASGNIRGLMVRNVLTSQENRSPFLTLSDNRIKNIVDNFFFTNDSHKVRKNM